MKISAKEQLGLRAIAELAVHYGAGPVPLSQVARAQDLSVAYLEQVVPALRTAGLINSTRGAKGGYTLARRPDKITVGEVLRALNGDILPVRCVTAKDTPPCPRSPSCAARTVWKTVHSRVLEALDSMTLADLDRDNE